tara:strand:+ start:162 stop:575 length:414 start_codon:yes stop_codon:yes gene_type:complete
VRVRAVILLEILISLGVLFLVGSILIKVLQQSYSQVGNRTWYSEASSLASSIIARVVSGEETALSIQDSLDQNIFFDIQLSSKPCEYLGLIEIEVVVSPLPGQAVNVLPVRIIELVPQSIGSKKDEPLNGYDIDGMS